MSCHEFENLLHYVYKSLAEGAMASSSTVTPTSVEGMYFEDKEPKNVEAVGGEVEESPGAEGAEKETSDAAEKETETAPEAEKVEGPRNAGDV